MSQPKKKKSAMRMLEWISVIEEIEKGYRLMLVDAEDGELRFYKSEIK